MQSSCNHHEISMQSACNQHVSLALEEDPSKRWMERVHRRDAISMHQHAIIMQSACTQHAIIMQSACNQHIISMRAFEEREKHHAISMQSACHQHARLRGEREAACNQHAISMSSACAPSRRERSGAMPPASTIETRFSAESDARLASAAAACS